MNRSFPLWTPRDHCPSAVGTIQASNTMFTNGEYDPWACFRCKQSGGGSGCATAKHGSDSPRSAINRQAGQTCSGCCMAEVCMPRTWRYMKPSRKGVLIQRTRRYIKGLTCSSMLSNPGDRVSSRAEMMLGMEEDSMGRTTMSMASRRKGQRSRREDQDQRTVLVGVLLQSSSGQPLVRWWSFSLVCNSAVTNETTSKWVEFRIERPRGRDTE